MDDSQLAELGCYYDQYMLGDPKAAETKQAGVIYRSIAKAAYNKESEEIRKRMTFERYMALVINVEVLSFLEKRQASVVFHK